MKQLVYTIVCTPILWLFFAYTKANIYSFWLGFFLCLIVELAIFMAYCGLKLHRAHRASLNIKLDSTCL
jgi:Na+-driven multidrug efflux pump